MPTLDVWASSCTVIQTLDLTWSGSLSNATGAPNGSLVTATLTTDDPGLSSDTLRFGGWNFSAVPANATNISVKLLHQSAISVASLVDLSALLRRSPGSPGAATLTRTIASFDVISGNSLYEEAGQPWTWLITRAILLNVTFVDFTVLFNNQDDSWSLDALGLRVSYDVPAAASRPQRRLGISIGPGL